MPGGCVFPVSAGDAFRWARGELQDLDLVKRAVLVPEAIYLAWLPDRASYRDSLRKIRYWRERGAVFMITRSGNEMIDAHLMNKNPGVLRSYWQDNGQIRYLCPPAPFAKWVSKWSRPK